MSQSKTNIGLLTNWRIVGKEVVNSSKNYNLDEDAIEANTRDNTLLDVKSEKEGNFSIRISHSVPNFSAKIASNSEGFEEKLDSLEIFLSSDDSDDLRLPSILQHDLGLTDRQEMITVFKRQSMSDLSLDKGSKLLENSINWSRSRPPIEPKDTEKLLNLKPFSVWKNLNNNEEGTIRRHSIACSITNSRIISFNDHTIEMSPNLGMFSVKNKNVEADNFNIKCYSFRWIFTVEFKSGRTEISYLTDHLLQGRIPQLGDLVIIEADRGEDLGKVSSAFETKDLLPFIDGTINLVETTDIKSKLISKLISSHGSNLNSVTSIGFVQTLAGEGIIFDLKQGLKHQDLALLLVNKEVVPKAIHRFAKSQDLIQINNKFQEEALAIVRCQSRIRQRKLPMDIIDAEYQWDRNKLTFYFVAEKRIDFRELVRDLFRIYKTRIWMCAVDQIRIQSLNNNKVESPRIKIRELTLNSGSNSAFTFS